MPPMVNPWLSFGLAVLSILVIPFGALLWRLSLSVALLQERHKQIADQVEAHQRDLVAEIANGKGRDLLISNVTAELARISGKLDMLLQRLPAAP